MFRPFALAATLAAAPACADGSIVSTDYLISIAGIEIGELAVQYEEVDGAYALNFGGGFRFLFISGEAEGRVTGARNDGAFAPAAYRLRFDGPTREVISDIRFSGGGPNVWTILPAPEREWMEGRVPLAEADMPGAVDPVSAFLAPASSAEEACNRRQKVFSGFVRFDITFTAAAPEANGVAPCRVAIRPISGHRLDENGEANLQAGDNMKVSMAELAPGVWAPHYLGFATSVGTLAFTRKN